MFFHGVFLSNIIFPRQPNESNPMNQRKLAAIESSVFISFHVRRPITEPDWAAFFFFKFVKITRL
jgi:hypothetical protein